MLQFLSNEVRDGLEAARKNAAKRRSRLRVHVGSAEYRILRYWQNGFALDGAHASHLRGLVDVYDGSKHIAQCLIMASIIENGELICEFKRSTAAQDTAPLDFERAEDRPVALLPRRF